MWGWPWPKATWRATEKEDFRCAGPKGVPSLTIPAPPPPPGFSTLEQLKRRNTLKDGIIMIQTLLIILFIIVPIFLLLDKVTSGGREAATGQARHKQGPRLPSPRACSLTHLFNHAFTHSVLLTEYTLPPKPWLLTPHPRPISLALPGWARQWMG